jgi:hypothetical protein
LSFSDIESLFSNHTFSDEEVYRLFSDPTGKILSQNHGWLDHAFLLKKDFRGKDGQTLFHLALTHDRWAVLAKVGLIPSEEFKSDPRFHGSQYTLKLRFSGICFERLLNASWSVHGTLLDRLIRMELECRGDDRRLKAITTMINQVISWGGMTKEELMRVTLSRVANDRLEGSEAAVLNDIFLTDSFSAAELRSWKAAGLVIYTAKDLELKIDSSEKLKKWLEDKLSKVKPIPDATVSAGGASGGGGGSGVRTGESFLDQKPSEKALMSHYLNASPRRIIQELCILSSQNPNIHWSFINDKDFLDVLRNTDNLMFWFLELMPKFLKSPTGLEFLGRRTEEAPCASVESVMERLLVLKQDYDRSFMHPSTAMAFHTPGCDRRSGATSDFAGAGGR